MSPSRIIFTRHAEQHGAPGVTENGASDAHSLTIRGWQRAGALARLLLPRDGPGPLTPDAIFASRIGEGSETRRPQQTASPLVALRPDVPYDTRHLKTEIDALMTAVDATSGIALVVWEHSMVPGCIARLNGAPSAPDEWPGERYDLFWICERDGTAGWTFIQRSQHLLACDR